MAKFSNWMKFINGNVILSELSIPGTHDSGSYDTWYGTEAYTGKCQTLNLHEQLCRKGIRFLDIRCRTYKDSLWVVHNFTDRSISFDYVLEICFEFLKTNPTETIIISLKQDYGKDKEEFSKIFQEKYVRPYQDLWFLENEIPNLSEVRGRLVLIRRFEAANIGIDASPDKWLNNTTFEITLDKQYLKIQDHYQVNYANNKWSDVSSHLNNAREEAKKKEFWYLNFTSGYVKDYYLLPNVKTVSNYVNKKLSEYPFNQKTSYGTIIMDFIDIIDEKNYDICKKIINTNLNADAEIK